MERGIGVEGTLFNATAAEDCKIQLDKNLRQSKYVICTPMNLNGYTVFGAGEAIMTALTVGGIVARCAIVAGLVKAAVFRRRAAVFKDSAVGRRADLSRKV